MPLDDSCQVAWCHIGGTIVKSAFPHEDSEVLTGVRWGSASEFFTPAFWKHQTQIQESLNRYTDHCLGRTLPEEIAACILGGYGIPAELGLAAFYRVRDEGLITRPSSVEKIEIVLSQPFQFGEKSRKYRFARQRAKYLFTALKASSEMDANSSDIELRNWLLTLPGIGPKTASWIVRNHLNSPNVAILDIHLVRAGIRMNLFQETEEVSKNYFSMEQKFLEFCRAIESPANILDAIIWDFMRRIGPTSRVKI